MFFPDPDLDFFTHPESRGQKGIGSLIRIRNTAYYGLKSPYSLVPSIFFFDIIYSFLHFSALEALRKKEISANKAAKVYKIPSSTLYKIARYIPYISIYSQTKGMGFAH
jgi:hypothetical protein